MPSESVAQQKLMQIAEHHPSAVSAKNRGVLQMSHQQLHDFAAGSEHGKPEHVGHPHENLGPYLHPKKAMSEAERRDHMKAARTTLHAHAAKHGHEQHQEAYADGAMAQRRGLHAAGGVMQTAAGHGYSGPAAEAYMAGARNEQQGMHAEPAPEGQMAQAAPQMSQASANDPDDEA